MQIPLAFGERIGSSIRRQRVSSRLPENTDVELVQWNQSGIDWTRRTRVVCLESSLTRSFRRLRLLNRLDCINSLPPNLIYKSASATANELAPILRAQGAQIVIAITHAREPSDLKLAEKVHPGLIDLILGGHDHFYGHHFVNNTHILRSGTDFKQLSYIEARWKPEKSGWDFDIIRHDLTRAIPEDEAMARLVDNLTSSLRSKLEKPIGYTAVPLDGRFTTIRTRESNLGNFICDLMRHYYNTDCALMGSGTIRGDQIYRPGVLLLKDMLNCFPFEDPVVVIRLKGKAILAALENGVSLVPALEGRHPQLSNIQFKYNPALPTGSRVMWVKIHDEDLDLDGDYTMATRGYMTRGKDGYSSLRVVSDGGVAEEVVTEENGILLSMILRQYFMSLKILGKWSRWSPSLHRHWGIVHERLHRDGRVHEPNHFKRGIKHKRTGTELLPPATGKTDVDGKPVDSDTDDEIMDHELETEAMDGVDLGASIASLRSVDDQKSRERHLAKVFLRRWMDIVGIQRSDVGMIHEHAESDLPHWTRGIAPRLEGRIIIHTGEADLAD